MKLCDEINSLVNIDEVKDDDNPKFLFTGISVVLLTAIVNKKINPIKLAQQELDNRGLNKKGKWIGFKKK